MGWTAAQKDASPRAAQIRAQDAKRARERRAARRAQLRAKGVTFRNSTKAEFQQRRESLLAIVREFHPMNVRSVYYIAVTRGVVAKTDQAYAIVDRDLVDMRRAGLVPYGWIVDGTRRRRTRYTCSSVAAALEDTRDQYRKALWNDINENVEFWVDKDGVAGTIMPVCDKFDVDVMPYKGQSSDTFAYEAAQHMLDLGKPTFIYHIGDHDFWGVKARAAIERKLKGFIDRKIEVHFEHISVTPDQIRKWKLPTRPSGSKKSRKAVKAFGPAVEIDAVPPDRLRALVEKTILKHMPIRQYNVLMAAEESERELLDVFISRAGSVDD